MRMVEFDDGSGCGKRPIEQHIPVGLDAINAYYGNPDVDGDGNMDPQWYSESTEVITLPYPMRLSWDRKQVVTKIRCHKLVSVSLMDALTEIADYNGAAWLKKEDLDLYGGCFNWRPVRGSTHKWSTHCWAIAIDLNPHLAPLGQVSRMPGFIVDAFVVRNWVWGGDFKRRDGMHFQACKGY